MLSKRESAVLKGCQYLDKEYPDWWKRVDLNRFNMTDGDRCAMYYGAGKNVWDELKYETSFKFRDERSLSSNTELWKEEILRRQANENNLTNKIKAVNPVSLERTATMRSEVIENKATAPLNTFPALYSYIDTTLIVLMYESGKGQIVTTSPNSGPLGSYWAGWDMERFKLLPTNKAVTLSNT